ncbi:hypothetical protein CTheo_8898 [Ceratobasidium theobromae]|uniref:Uncharacterized protein n=1 Tax=Ceratobasidium theobromae TaxID=1582974 RepID=A0A5N5Q7C4_9AGAM|nr:hypothetical protein CTheo_8898 [Ceratobasidium theobromae]
MAARRSAAAPRADPRPRAPIPTAMPYTADTDSNTYRTGSDTYHAGSEAGGSFVSVMYPRHQPFVVLPWMLRKWGNYSQGSSGRSQGSSTYIRSSSAYQASQAYAQSSATYTQGSNTYVPDDASYTEESDTYTQGPDTYTQGARTLSPPPVPPKLPRTPRGARTHTTPKWAMSPVTPKTPNPNASYYEYAVDPIHGHAQDIWKYDTKDPGWCDDPPYAGWMIWQGFERSIGCANECRGLDAPAHEPRDCDKYSCANALWYLNVHAPPPFEWLCTQAVLYPNVLILSWIAPTGGRGVVTLDLVNCTEVRSAPSPSHPSARDDVGRVAARLQSAELAETLCPFQLLYSDGVERLGTDTAMERVWWVGAIWDVLMTISRTPTRALTDGSVSESGSLHTSFCSHSSSNAYGSISKSQGICRFKRHGHPSTISSVLVFGCVHIISVPYNSFIHPQLNLALA